MRVTDIGDSLAPRLATSEFSLHLQRQSPSTHLGLASNIWSESPTFSLLMRYMQCKCLVLCEPLNIGKRNSVSIWGGQLISVRSHVFGQAAKKEHALDNVKVSGSAWDTNLVAASGVRFYHR